MCKKKSFKAKTLVAAFSEKEKKNNKNRQEAGKVEKTIVKINEQVYNKEK